MPKIKKGEVADKIIEIIYTFFGGKLEIPKKELMKINKVYLMNLYIILNELKQKRLDDYVPKF